MKEGVQEVEVIEALLYPEFPSARRGSACTYACFFRPIKLNEAHLPDSRLHETSASLSRKPHRGVFGWLVE